MKTKNIESKLGRVGKIIGFGISIYSFCFSLNAAAFWSTGTYMMSWPDEYMGYGYNPMMGYSYNPGMMNSAWMGFNPMSSFNPSAFYGTGYSPYFQNSFAGGGLWGGIGLSSVYGSLAPSYTDSSSSTYYPRERRERKARKRATWSDDSEFDFGLTLSTVENFNRNLTESKDLSQSSVCSIDVGTQTINDVGTQTDETRLSREEPSKAVVLPQAPTLLSQLFSKSTQTSPIVSTSASTQTSSLSSAPASVVAATPSSAVPASPLNVKTLSLAELRKKFGKDFSSLSGVMNKLSTDRKKLNELREKGIREFRAVLANTPSGAQADVAKVAASITENFKGYVNQVIKEEVEALEKEGYPGQESESYRQSSSGGRGRRFAVFSLGSVPRKEAGLYSDVEIGILTDENTGLNQVFFSRLSQRISDRIHLMGEGEEGIHIDVAGNSPPHYEFENRYIDPVLAKDQAYKAKKAEDFERMPRLAGTRLLIATPERLASYSDSTLLPDLHSQDGVEYYSHKHRDIQKLKPVFDSRDPRSGAKQAQYWNDLAKKPFLDREMKQVPELASMSRNIDFLYGDYALFEEYLQRREGILNAKPKNPRVGGAGTARTVRERISYDKLSFNLGNINAARADLLKGELPGKLNIKRDLYRIVEQILTSMGSYYGIHSQSTIEIADELFNKGILPKSTHREAKDLMNFLLELRLKSQIAMKNPGKEIYFSALKQRQDKELLETRIKIIKVEAKIRLLNKDIANRALQDESDYPYPGQRTKMPDEAAKRAQQTFLSKAGGELLELSKAEGELRELNRLSAKSIFDEKDIERLKTQYLPSYKRLFDFANAWLEKNRIVNLAAKK